MMFLGGIPPNFNKGMQNHGKAKFNNNATNKQIEVKCWVDETGVDKTGVDETGVDETGVDETGVDETVVDERGVDELGCYQGWNPLKPTKHN